MRRLAGSPAGLCPRAACQRGAALGQERLNSLVLVLSHELSPLPPA